MDIENMHPFCLPFSLCHDATSSSITDDISSTLLHNKDNDRSNKTSASSNNNNDNSIENNRPRSKGATSPMEDIFNRFDASLSPPSNRSLLQDECLIDSSNTYNALHLDIDMVTNLNDSHETCASEFGLNDDGATESLCKNDDWFSTTTTPSTHDCSLFSPIDSITDSLTKQRKYLKGAYYSALNNNNNNNQHHQVFHVVDPIDIKSSPTLAQLNLNSNDDPTDNLWDTNSSTATATLSISTRAQTPNLFSDLLSSCINGAPMRSCINNNGLTTCSHQIHNQQANSATAPYAPHQGNSQLSPLCHHLYHHHHHNHMGNNGRCNSSQTQSTCLAVAPFRKNVDLQRAITHNHSSCCVNHHHHSHNQNYHVHSQSYLGNSSIASQQANCADHQKLMTAANSHCNSNELIAPRQQLTTASIDNHQRHHHNHHQQQQQFKSQHQRCSSPAPLVTSSSSPLSSSLAQNMLNDTRLTDNKLKENIEYLTVLLCSGNNKLDKQTNPQQSSISSTIVKPYSTLAQSLSTEPKLLEKYQQQQLNHHNNNNNHRPGTNSVALNNQHSGLASGSKLLSTNEASPQIAANMNTQHTNISNLFEPQDGAKKMSPDQWFKPSTIESSVSAADSTAENQLSANADRAVSLRTNAGVMLNGCLSYHHSHPTSAGIQSDLNPVSRQNEMKVLSSLLNSNLDRALPTTDSNLIVANHQTNNCAIWRTPCNQNIDIQNQNPTSNQTLIAPGGILSNDLYTSNQQTQQTHQQISSNSQYNQNTSSIPPNGRPITLTPLVSNNVMISQRQAPPQILTQPQQQPQQAPQQQQQTSIKSKAPTFVQPASPSASSTTSSSGNTEIGSSSTSVAPVKRQKDFNQTKSSDRSARPNSLSTECSLSSHDEGFSSQIDQDDCANSMRADSDDDSDIDSDDESFYGDYTNSDLIGASISDNPECKWTLTMGRTRRNGQKRFFWQYNVQSKGPKGTRISSADGSENPFVLPEASDPVFSNDCQIEGVKHSGKARRGDGNDLTPNPKKLLMIGLELKKLSKIINDLAPVTDLPINARNKTRKEKNKLASRACRLKKKAQHEANKIKLYGLQREHQQVVMAIYDIRKFLRESLAQDHIKQEAQQSLKEKKLGTYVKSLVDQCSITVAGKTSDYVNSVLEKVVSGFIDGGL